MKNGDEILVSERGKIVARIVPAGGTSEDTRLKNLLLKLSTEGKIILPRIQKKPSRPFRRKKVRGTPFSDAIIEGRR